MAAKEGRYKIIRYLVARGADINIKDRKGVCKYMRLYYYIRINIAEFECKIATLHAASYEDDYHFFRITILPLTFRCFCDVLCLTVLHVKFKCVDLKLSQFQCFRAQKESLAKQQCRLSYWGRLGHRQSN